MKTLLTRSAAKAAEYIRGGGLAAFPTETVYGLGANVYDAEAVAKIFAAKRRPADNPLIAHVASVDQIQDLVARSSEDARKLIAEFFPGALTVVMTKSDRVPPAATAGLSSIGVRMPDSALAIEFIRACGVPLVAPSANLSGKPSPTTREAVLEDLGGRIDCTLKGAPTQIGLESTVVDCTSDPPVLLRQGAVTLQDLRRVIPELQASWDHPDQAARSPGLRHRHYSPRAKVVIAEPGTQPPGGSASAFIGTHRPAGSFDILLVCDSVDEYASRLFEFFRAADRAQIDTIYCEAVAESGIGAALMDRIRRAAEA